MTDPTRPDDRLLWALQERAKELRCLYEIEELLNRPETPLDEVFQGVIRAVPPGWQYPEVCQASVDYEGRTYAPPDFVATSWVQSADIVIQDRVVGRVNVFYTQEMPPADVGPFLAEETRLIRTIADRLGHYVLHQRMRTLVTELHDAQEKLSEDASEWRVAVQLLRRTDQELFVRLARKMANHLLWSGIPAAQELLQDLGIQRLREEEERLVGERNEPSARQPLDASLGLADKVFDLAGRHLPDAEILTRIQSWMHADRASFFVKAALDPRSAPGEVADAIRRYLHLVPQGAEIELPLLANVRAALIRRFLSEEPQYVGLARHVLTLEDILELLDHLVALPGSSGRVGGKAAGLFLASRLLRDPAGGKSAMPVRIPKSWYVATDCSPAFIRYNNLEEMFEQKYKPTDQVRLQYPHVVQVFKNSAFPPELVRNVSSALDDLHEGPLVVRSSSLLEDRLGSAFSGKYKSLFLSNRGSKRERLAAVLDAIAEVYASIFGPDPIQYRAERGLLESREEMGILLQEVVGRRVGRWHLPAYAGVAMSHNEFRWSSRIRREDGLIRLVPGLGTRAVDRIRDDYPVLIAPGQPGLRVNVTADEVMRYSPHDLDAVDLDAGALASVEIASLLRSHGDAFPQAHRIVSELVDDRVVKPTGKWIDFESTRVVVTFEGLTDETPFVSQMAGILRTLESRLGHPVEIEFASDGEDFYLLQCRPQTDSGADAPVRLPRDLPRERILFTANRYVSNGHVADISHIVYVDPEGYAALGDADALRAVGRAVSKLNQVLPKRRFILMGPGRWGSRGDIKLGVNVTYSDINNTAVLIEVARRRGTTLPDLSFGTHFFQDLVEAKIRYLPLYPDDPEVVFDETFFRESPNDLAALLPEFAPLEPVVRVIDVARATGGKVARLFLNADLDAAVGALCDPRESVAVDLDPPSHVVRHEDHWRWRLRMAERIAASLDPSRFGVAALYLIGSVKNASAGPSSDIDLLLHFHGDADQKQALQLWLNGWSECLDEVNFLRTGKRAGGLLDVHFVTDADLAARTSFAIKIGAVTDAALPLPLGDPGGPHRGSHYVPQE